MFLCDWSYGKLYAAHLKPEGAGYSAEVEEFVTGTPLPLTDVVVNPKDGAMYFAIGGRKTTSGLYRVTYTSAPNRPTTEGQSPRRTRSARCSTRSTATPIRRPSRSPGNTSRAPTASSATAARVALEFQDPSTWRDKALNETDPLAALEALLALVHVSASDPAHRDPAAPAPDQALGGEILGALGKLDWSTSPMPGSSTRSGSSRFSSTASGRPTRRRASTSSRRSTMPIRPEGAS